MLKFNGHERRICRLRRLHLNTSNVKVQLLAYKNNIVTKFDFNTSNVKVQQNAQSALTAAGNDLNTSNVKVQPNKGQGHLRDIVI